MIKIPIILASKSSRRSRILKQIGLKFEIIPSNISEKLENNLHPKKLAELLSLKKARKVSDENKSKIIIGADTIISLNKKPLGKPKDENDNYKMLKSLSGKTHKVFTGVSIIHKKCNIQRTFNQMTKVTVRDIPENEILYYINKYHSLDKAGGYGIQDRFSVWIKNINGCFFNVMGLPMSKFYKTYADVLKEIKYANNK